MNISSTLVARLALATTLGVLPLACAQLPAGFALPSFGSLEGSEQTEGHEAHSSRSETTEEINGRRVRSSSDEDEDDDDAPRKKKRKSRAHDDDEDEDEDDAPRTKKAKKGAGDDIGATCHKNDECSARACFVGNGSIGYCTKMCNSWSDCPSHWECKKPGNAPQKICMQDD